MFDLETTSKNILSEAFNIAEANGRPGYALNGLLAEVLSSTQTTERNQNHTGEGVILIKDSPSGKKDKSGPPTTITQFTQATATTTTQQGLVASNLRQIQAEQQGRTFFREILQRYHYQLARCENTTKVCISKGGRHFILNQEAPKLWNNTIITQEATI